MCLGIPARVVTVGDGGRGVVDVDGVRREVSLALLEDDAPVQEGEWVLLHVGFALARIDEDEATRTLALLREAGEAYARELAALRGQDGP